MVLDVYSETIHMVTRHNNELALLVMNSCHSGANWMQWIAKLEHIPDSSHGWGKNSQKEAERFGKISFEGCSILPRLECHNLRIIGEACEI